MRINAMNEEFEEVEVFGYPMIFTCLRVDRDSVPKGLYMYEVRHGDECDGDPVQIGERIIVNHWGTIISNRPIKLYTDTRNNLGFRDINPEEDWNYFGSEITVSEYMETNPPMNKIEEL